MCTLVLFLSCRSNGVFISGNCPWKTWYISPVLGDKIANLPKYADWQFLFNVLLLKDSVRGRMDSERIKFDLFFISRGFLLWMTTDIDPWLSECIDHWYNYFKKLKNIYILLVFSSQINTFNSLFSSNLLWHWVQVSHLFSFFSLCLLPSIFITLCIYKWGGVR